MKFYTYIFYRLVKSTGGDDDGTRFDGSSNGSSNVIEVVK